MDRSLPSPSCSGGCGPRPRGTVSSGASSWPFRATMDLPVIILSHRLPKARAQTDAHREEERHGRDYHGRRVERVLNRLRQADDHEGEHDRRHAEEEDDQRQEQDRHREGASAAAAPFGEPIELREGGVRQRGEEPEQPGDESTRAPSRQFDHGRSSDAERGYDEENRKGRERREVEPTQEANGGAECETEEDLQ